MIAASEPRQRPLDARLLVLDRKGKIVHLPRADLVDFLETSDLVIANDAATLPASFAGFHEPTGARIEVRLAGRRSLANDDVARFTAVVFGAGDFHTRTEDRPLPPRLIIGDRLVLGPLVATVKATLDHPRLVALVFAGSPDAIWEGFARHGRPVQYAHVPTPLALWDVWTPIAAGPVAFEPPSAGFVLDWRNLAAMRARGIEFATITHAAGLSSTGDAELDARLPFDEPYAIPQATLAAIRRAKRQRRRIVAIGTTVVRALEHAALRHGSVRAGNGIATQRIGPRTRLRVVDAIVSGAHEPGSSHHELLRAFLDDRTLRRVTDALIAHGYRTHEFGDSVLIARQAANTARHRSNSRIALATPLHV
ncbi:MAG: S-adenosylmethionine:tRNA ribosyltransferase-isomerase [Betaproteobacteria bacterium]|nr:S-adenosylmethionine:tRNA ribosyltransferase-isomerase [Betaproteobacteria bacterium]